MGARAYFYAPSLSWLFPGDHALLAFCALGCVAGIALAAGVLQRASAVLCFVLYLSLSSVGQPFTSFQWDSLLLEAGFLAIFLGAPWLHWAYRLLLFRLMFESGWVKLASHDPNWRNLHALRFHFMTQPLPNPVAYYFHWAPTGLLDSLTAAALAIELLAPFLLFGPRLVRWLGVALLMSLQAMILLTGNYGFFNLLSLALCLWALDDVTFAPLDRLLRWSYPKWPRWGRPEKWRWAGNSIVAAIGVLGLAQLAAQMTPRSAQLLTSLVEAVQPFEIVNSYGLFAVMTTTRPEIVIEGSDDRLTWREYQFFYKPGNTHRGLSWVAPYQPRLDWQMWFAALGDYQNNTWVSGLMYRLLTGEPAVTKLLEPSPFQRPPRYMRALLYEYNFTDPAERKKTGAVWRRELKGVWFGPVSLTGS